MAPEQVRREVSDRRADVFSLGVVLYELLTDVKPFGGDSLAQIRDAVLNHEPPLANKVDPAVPKALAAIAARAMAKDPEHRFRSARSFARELRQWLDENPTSADGEKTAPFAAPPARPSRVVLGVVVAAFVAAVMGAVATWFILMPTAPALADTAASPSETRARPLDRRRAGRRRPLPVERAPAAATRPSRRRDRRGDGDDRWPPRPPSPRRWASRQDDRAGAGTDTADALDRRGADAVGSGDGRTAPPATSGEAERRAAGPRPAAPPRESAKDKKAREAREREARENDARVAAAARLVAPATGTVKIAISPWGLVEVDGASSGAAPPITELTLAEGRHQIVIRNGDYAPHTVSVNVTAGQTISVRHKFGS